MFDFRDRNVFVAGGATGINLAIADAFAYAGANVAVLSRCEAEVDVAVLKLLAWNRGEVLGLKADVEHALELENALGTASSKWSGLDVVVSIGAENLAAPVKDTSAGEFRSCDEVDLLGSFGRMCSFWPHLRKPGALLNIAAPQNWMPPALEAPECAARAGVRHLTRGLAIAWGRHGVRVNAIAPAATDQAWWSGSVAPAGGAPRVKAGARPVNRWASADDICNAALWLCSPMAGNITGAILPIDGGMSLGRASRMRQAERPPWTSS